MSLLTKRVRGSMKFSRSCHYKASHYLWEYDGRFEELFVGMEVLGSTHLYDTHESQTNIHIVLIAVFGCSARSDIFLILQLSRRESRRFSRGVSREATELSQSSSKEPSYPNQSIHPLDSILDLVDVQAYETAATNIQTKKKAAYRAII